MKKRLIALIIAPLLGAVLGYLLTNAMNNGWFSSGWQRIEGPPDNVHRLVAVSKGSLWIESEFGILYFNAHPSSCRNECWQEVSDIPALPIVEPYEASVTDSACVSSPPLSRVTAMISECRVEMWVDRNTTIALLNDGSIYLWQAVLSKEWSAELTFLGVCIGAIALFIPTLVVVLINWLINRAHEKQRARMATAV